ncbi:NitT/TauT family transport system substrate-binding protein [Frankia sp. Hr75.2]|nr:NitT/TauT family transport system substrate-binding protein [Frankia sp. Hr75.2]
MSGYRMKATLVLSLFAILGLAACGGGAAGSDGPSDRDHLEVMLLPGSNLIPVVTAQEQGFFDAAGLKVSVVDQPAQLGSVQALTATGAELTQISTASLIESWQAGASLTAVCGGQQTQLMTLLAAKDSALPSMDSGASPAEVLRNLDGAVIGFPTPEGTGFQKQFAAALANAGVRNVTYVNVGVAAPQVYAALTNGAVDVAASFPTAAQFILDSGKGKKLLLMPDGSPLYRDAYFTVWAGLPGWVEDNPEAARKFCTAIDQALTFLHEDANDAVTTARITKTLRVSPAVASRALADGVWDTYSVKFTKEQFDSTLDILLEAGVVADEKVPAYTDLVRPALP